MKDYIYIISNENGFVKVGIAKNPAKRLAQLQTGSPFKLNLFYVEEFTCTRRHLLHIEKELHRTIRNKENKSMGEWFKADTEQIEKIKTELIWHRMRYENDEMYFKHR